MNDPTTTYEVRLDGVRVVLQVRDAAGCHWSIGALLGDKAAHYDGEDVGVVWVPVSEVLPGAQVAGIKVITEDLQ